MLKTLQLAHLLFIKLCPLAICALSVSFAAAASALSFASSGIGIISSIGADGQKMAAVYDDISQLSGWRPFIL